MLGRWPSVQPAAVWSGSVPDLPDTFVGLPARLGPRGLVAVEPSNLDEEETTALRHAATSVRTAADDAAAGPA